MIERTTELDSIGLVLLAILGGAGYGLVTAAQKKLTREGPTKVEWKSVARLVLENAVGGALVVASVEAFGIEPLQATAPAAAIYVDKAFQTWRGIRERDGWWRRYSR